MVLFVGVESNCIFVDKNDMIRVKEGLLILFLVKEMVLEFSNDFVNYVLIEVLIDIDVNSYDVILEDYEDVDDVLILIMKKFLIGVFGRLLEKNWEYLENFLFLKLLLKCLECILSGINILVILSIFLFLFVIWVDIK